MFDLEVSHTEPVVSEIHHAELDSVTLTHPVTQEASGP